jgi:isocitrate dehydrogenase
MHYDHITPPHDGEPITANPDFTLNVPDRPIIPFIEGDGIGIDVTPVARKVVDAAVQLAYGSERAIAWLEVYAGQKATGIYGGSQFLPEETLDALERFIVSIKGPLSTPIGGGFRSLNVSIRQRLDLYACVRPIRYFPGVQTPMKDSELVSMTVFRENTEDIYAGIEWPAGSPEAQKLMKFLQDELHVHAVRFPSSSGLGIKPVSKEGSQRLVRKAINFAVDENRSSVTLVHKGNIMKYTEGAFRNWGYQLARDEFGATELGDGPWLVLQQSAHRPRDCHQGRDRRQLPAADPAEPGGLRRHRDPEPQRRLHFRRARRAGRRDRHRSRAPISAMRWRCSRRPTARRRGSPARTG